MRRGILLTDDFGNSASIPAKGAAEAGNDVLRLTSYNRAASSAPSRIARFASSSAANAAPPIL
jgi:hypothetical protein